MTGEDVLSFMEMMKTRWIGLCPCCGGTWKVSETIALALHGYRRPGVGHVYGQCFGAGREPHEASPKTAQDFLVVLNAQKVREEAHLAYLHVTTTLMVRKWNTRGGTVVEMNQETTPEFEWNREKNAQVRETENTIESLTKEVARVQGLIDTWERKPLVTFEEEAQKTALVKAEREAKKAEALEAKRTAKIANIQKRIDTSMRTKSTSSLSTIFETIGRLHHDLKMTSPELHARIDRAHVWALFGLIPGTKYGDPEAKANTEILGDMKAYFKPYPWPNEKA